jgi:SAM-dependent methyltransferase
VISTGLLEHFEDPSPIVHEMVRVLKGGGVFYSDIVPRKFSLFRSLDWVRRLKPEALSSRTGREEFYERCFTLPEVRSLLENAGLVGVTVVPAGVVPPYVPVLYRVRWLRESQVRLVERTRRMWARFDGTRFAEWFGFYYFASATKPAAGHSPRGQEPPASL